MRLTSVRAMILAALCAAVPATARAQDGPDGEVGLGYSFMSVDVGVGPLDRRLATNGWFLSLQDNFTDYVGVVVEGSGHYRGSGNVHTVMAGPRFNYRNDSRLEPFAHVMAGAAFYDSFDETKFAMAAGGGLDVKVNEHVAIRAIQADYVPTFFSNVRHNARVQAGVVFRFTW